MNTFPAEAWPAIALTLQLASLTTAILLLLATPLLYAAAWWGMAWWAQASATWSP